MYVREAFKMDICIEFLGIQPTNGLVVPKKPTSLP